MSSLDVVVGGLYGSEAKGHAVQRVTERILASGGQPQVIRVAGPNAGHTGYDEFGNPWALRQVPVAAVVPGTAMLGIAAGSEIDLPVLLAEIDALTGAGLMDDKILWISGEATMIYDEHKDTEGALVGAIGSTGKGIGAARSDRIMRQAARLLDDNIALDALQSRGAFVTNKPDIPANFDNVVLEGTQGYALGLHAGFYPKCTSSNCRAIDFMAMAGVHPWQFDQTRVWVTARIYPIRVAGNSGPLKNETSWEGLGLPKEHTTVTKKVRRVGMPDWDLVAQAVAANGGSPTARLVLTMLDQKFPQVAGMTSFEMLSAEAEVMEYLLQVQDQTKAKIELATTGPNSAVWI